MAQDVPPDDEDPTPLFEVQDDRVDPLSLDLVSEEDEQERAEQERQERERAEREREGDEPPDEPGPTEEGPPREPPPPSVVGIEQAPPAGLDLRVPDDGDGAMVDAGPDPYIPELVEEPAPAPVPPEADPEEFEPLPDIEPVLSEDPIEPASPIDDTLT